MDIKDVFIGNAKKYNNYQKCEKTICRQCIDCIRWRLSFPYSCNDYNMRSDKAETCLNYTTDKNCKVD